MENEKKKINKIDVSVAPNTVALQIAVTPILTKRNIKTYVVIQDHKIALSTNPIIFIPSLILLSFSQTIDLMS